MTPEGIRQSAEEWLLPKSSGLWEWDEKGDEIVWLDGGTVVFRRELKNILQSLAPRGLPPAGALILLLAACRGKIPDTANLDVLFALHGTPAGEPRKMAEATCVLLANIQKLPAWVIATVSAKAAFIDRIFPQKTRGSREQADAVIETLSEALPLLLWRNPESSRPTLLSELHLLHELLSKVDEVALDLALKTGLPGIPEAAEIDLPMAERIALLLKEIDDDSDLSVMVQLTRDIMAALTLPRALPQIDPDAPAGYSDIGNRGSLHRLLISELAHDDDTLAMRIALNEALYLRREPTASQPPATMAVLLDSGLRMWGTPRIFSTAVALACLGKMPKSAMSPVFRASEENAELLRLDRREGLVDHLAAQEISLNPGAALSDMITQLAGYSGSLDVFIITHADTLSDPEFLKSLADAEIPAPYVVAVDQNGNLGMYLRTLRSWQTLASVRLDLSSLFKTPSRVSVVKEGLLEYKPAIFYARAFPFLLSTDEKMVITRKIAKGGMGITKEGSIWHWDDNSRGGRRLPLDTLAGKTIALLHDSKNEGFILVKHITNTTELIITLWKEDSGWWGHTAPQVWKLIGYTQPPEHIALHREMLLVFRKDVPGHPRGVEAINPQTGMKVASLPIQQDLEHSGGRFYFNSAAYEHIAVSWDGVLLRLDSVSSKAKNISGRIIRIFDRGGMDGPWVVNVGGSVQNLAAPETSFDLGIKHPTVLRVSQSGHRLFAKDSKGSFYVVDLITQKVDPVHVKSVNDVPELLESSASFPVWTLRRKFSAVSLHPNGRIFLRSSTKLEWFAIGNHGKRQQLEFHRIKSNSEEYAYAKRTQVPFLNPNRDNGDWFRLSIATLANGALVWLDTRGMIHLKAAAVSIPEITIVLAESSSLPAWTSDGIIIGPTYFTGEQSHSEEGAERITGWLRQMAGGLE